MRCATCNYDLRGLPDESICPECGTCGRLQVVESRSLRFATREWAWTLSFVLVSAAVLSMARPLSLVRLYAQYESWTAAWNNVFCSHPFGPGVYATSAKICAMSAGLVALSRRFGVRKVGAIVLVATTVLFWFTFADVTVHARSVFGWRSPGQRSPDDPFPLLLPCLMVSGVVVIVSLRFGQRWNSKNLINRANRSPL